MTKALCRCGHDSLLFQFYICDTRAGQVLGFTALSGVTATRSRRGTEWLASHRVEPFRWNIREQQQPKIGKVASIKKYYRQLVPGRETTFWCNTVLGKALQRRSGSYFGNPQLMNCSMIRQGSKTKRVLMIWWNPKVLMMTWHGSLGNLL